MGCLRPQTEVQTHNSWERNAPTPKLFESAAFGPGDCVDVALGQAHRIANQDDDTLVIIEVQRGAYTGEDDIVRLEDDYGRSED